MNGVRLAAPVLVVTDRGEVDGRAGDYLVIADDGRQVIMTEAEYLAATGAAESSSPGIPEAPSPPAKRKPNFLSSIINRKRPATPAPVQVLEDPPVEEVPDVAMTKSQDPEICYNLPAEPPGPEAVVRPPPPSQEGRSLSSLESLVIPRRPEGSFRRFMRPGPPPAPKTAKKAKKRPAMVLPFQKKKVQKEKDPTKERYRYVKPEWV